MTSPEVRFLVLAFAAAVLVLWVASIRRTRRISRLVDEAKKQNYDAWIALPVITRMFSPLGGLRRLCAEGVLTDPVICDQLAEIGAAYTRHMILAATILALMTISLLVTPWFGWVW